MACREGAWGEGSSGRGMRRVGMRAVAWGKGHEEWRHRGESMWRGGMWEGA